MADRLVMFLTGYTACLVYDLGSKVDELADVSDERENVANKNLVKGAVVGPPLYQICMRPAQMLQANIAPRVS
jgi:hypothetical protein